MSAFAAAWPAIALAAAVRLDCARRGCMYCGRLVGRLRNVD